MNNYQIAKQQRYITHLRREYKELFGREHVYTGKGGLEKNTPQGREPHTRELESLRCSIAGKKKRLAEKNLEKIQFERTNKKITDYFKTCTNKIAN